MSKLHWTAKDVFGLPGMPDWARYAAIDEDRRGFYIYEIRPNMSHTIFTAAPGYPEERKRCVAFEHDFTGDWKDSPLERPQEVRKGDFVKAWDWCSRDLNNDIEPDDWNEDLVAYGYVREMGKDYFCISGNGYKFPRVRVMNPPTRKE